jgi:uncharacterized phiE125 gp8 family phage protein
VAWLKSSPGKQKKMAGLSQQTSAAETTISRQELADHLRIDDQAETDVLDAIILAAETYAEEITGRSFVSKTYLYTLERWHRLIILPRPPVTSITSIQYVDNDGATQVLASNRYQLDAQGFVSCVKEAYGETWPSIRHGVVNPIAITYVAGYADAASVPAPIKQAVKLIASDLWTNREDSAPVTLQPVPFAARTLLAPYKVTQWGW